MHNLPAFIQDTATVMALIHQPSKTFKYFLLTDYSIFNPTCYVKNYVQNSAHIPPICLVFTRIPISFQKLPGYSLSFENKHHNPCSCEFGTIKGYSWNLQKHQGILIDNQASYVYSWIFLHSIISIQKNLHI